MKGRLAQLHSTQEHFASAGGITATVRLFGRHPADRLQHPAHLSYPGIAVSSLRVGHS